MSLLDSPALKNVNEQYELLRAKYYSLAERDRLSLLILAIFLGCVLFYYLIVAPINASLTEAKASHQSKQELIAWIKANEAVAKRNRNSGASPSRGNQSILTVVNSTSQRANIELKRVEPKGEDGIRVWMEEAAFNDVVNWINDLSTRYGVNVVNITLEQKKDPGLVDASIILQG